MTYVITEQWVFGVKEFTLILMIRILFGVILVSTTRKTMLIKRAIKQTIRHLRLIRMLMVTLIIKLAVF